MRERAKWPMAIPFDVNTGLQSGPEVHTGTTDVIVGYLATHPNGYEARLGPDRARAELYAQRNHATLEPMFARRRVG